MNESMDGSVGGSVGGSFGRWMHGGARAAQGGGPLRRGLLQLESLDMVFDIIYLLWRR